MLFYWHSNFEGDGFFFLHSKSTPEASTLLQMLFYFPKYALISTRTKYYATSSCQKEVALNIVSFRIIVLNMISV